MITPHEYQYDIINNAFDKLSSIDKLLIQANTGAGKTVIMAFICKQWLEEKRGKIVITCHRKELVDQTVSTLKSIGISAQSFTASSRHKHNMVDVHVTMIETLYRRLLKDRFSTAGVTLVISDECHIQVHNKVYDYFDAKVIGFTATPVLMKRETFYKCKYCKSEHDDITECCGEEIEEWSRPYTMSRIYDDIIVGPPFSKLIEIGQLVQDVSFVKKYADTSDLKTDASGEYTQQSLNKAYSSDNSLFNVVLNYEQLCKGKRTMVFNPSTKVNKLVYDRLIQTGYNAKMYDSVNDSDVSRTELVKWFNETEDAILCNCSVFTTGFDSREVQAIIVNRSTKSLSLWLQIVGRGGRSSNKIFKQDFVVVDGGDNIAEFGEWSSERDWENIFWNGIGKPKPKKILPDDIQDCPECGYLFDKYEDTCPGCGHTIKPPPPREKKEQGESEEVLEPIRKIPPPSGKHIYEYTKRRGENINFAFRTLQNRIFDMFIYWRVSRDKYLSSLRSGELDRKIKKHMLPAYFFLIKQQDIQTGQHRTINYMVNKTKGKLEKYYYGR